VVTKKPGEIRVSFVRGMPSDPGDAYIPHLMSRVSGGKAI
jgi:hypothetical protein